MSNGNSFSIGREQNMPWWLAAAIPAAPRHPTRPAVTSAPI